MIPCQKRKAGRRGLLHSTSCFPSPLDPHGILNPGKVLPDEVKR